jgi:hypothetical protein
MQEGAHKSPTLTLPGILGKNCIKMKRAALVDWADDLVLICESMVFVFVVSPMVLIA